MIHGNVVLCVKKGKWHWEFTDVDTRHMLLSRVGSNSPGAALDSCLREIEDFYAYMCCRFAA